MRIRRLLFVLLVLLLLLPGCGRTLDADTQDRLMDLPKAGERLLLFLNKTEDHGGWGYGNEQFYVPLNLRREPPDGKGLRLLEALREYGKKYPREWLGLE